MPYAPGTLTLDSRPPRAERERARKSSWDARRGTSQERGYDSRWQRARLGYLAKHPLCVRCMDDAVVEPARHVDHIQPHRGDKALFWNSDNWQALCESCHNAKTAGEDRHSVYMPAGLAPSKPCLTIVAGAPGSGKSTYVAQRLGRNDVFIDLDLIMSGITGSAERTWHRPTLERALVYRNTQLRALAHSDAPRAWFIVTAAKRELRKQWGAALGASETVICYAPPSICKQRVTADASRRLIWHEQHGAIDRWHAAFTYRQSETITRTDGAP